MTFIRKTLTIAAAAGSMLIGTANAAFIPYWFDADGAGAGQAVKVDEFMNINSAFLGINKNYVGANYDFDQYGLAAISGINGGTLFDLPNAATTNAFGGVAAKYHGSGTGNLTNGTFSFTSGKIEFFNPGFLNANKFVEFDIVSGGGLLNGQGIPNGLATLVASVSWMSAGYFFFDNGGMQGQDMSLLPPLDLANVFGFSTTNASLITNASQRNTVDTKLSAAYADAAVQNANGANLFDVGGRPTQFYVDAGGQFRMQVPEPGALALVAIGLLAASATRRRNKQQA